MSEKIVAPNKQRDEQAATTSQTPVVVMRNRATTAWPVQGLRRCEIIDLAAALETHWPDDAHFCCAVASGPPKQPIDFAALGFGDDGTRKRGKKIQQLDDDPANVARRLANDAIGIVPIAIHALVIDVDDNEAKKEGRPASEEWIDAQLERFEALGEAHPDFYSYRTRGGLRLIWRLASPFAVETSGDADRWSAGYGCFLDHLRDDFGIHGDRACADVGRLYRLPSVKRDGKRTEVMTLGDAANIGTIDFAPFAAMDPWVRSALASAETKIKRAANGTRHKILFGEALSLGGFVPGGHLDRDVLRARLLAAISTHPDADPAKDEEAIDDGIAAGIKAPRDPETEGSNRPRKRRAARPQGEQGAPQLPEIQITAKLADNMDEAIAALASDQNLYTRDGVLAHVTRVTREEAASSDVVRDATDDRGERRELVEGTPLIRETRTATLCARLTRVADFVRWDKRSNGLVPTLPTERLVDAIHAQGEWPGLRPLVGIAETPFLRPDGTVAQDAGYDATGYLYAPSIEFPRVPDAPTQKECAAAYKLLAKLFADFPFVDESHRAVPIAGALTIVARPAIRGAVPGFIFDGNTRGGGQEPHH